MKKKNNFLFMKHLVDSDFLLTEQSLRKSSRYVKSTFQLPLESKMPFVLDPIELVKSLKQFARLLQFLKKQKHPFLHLLVKNKQYIHFLDFFIKKSTNCLPIAIKNKFFDTKLQKMSQMLMLLDQSLCNDPKLFKRIVYSNIFLINKINSKLEQNSLGTYKVYNDLSNLKKLTFLLALLRQIYQKNQ